MLIPPKNTVYKHAKGAENPSVDLVSTTVQGFVGIKWSKTFRLFWRKRASGWGCKIYGSGGPYQYIRKCFSLYHLLQKGRRHIGEKYGASI